MRLDHSLLAIALAALLPSTSLTWAQSYIPDPERTPGAAYPYVTQDNIKETACVASWTRRVRPSSSYTTRLKVQQMREFGLAGDIDDYDEDHLVPLCVGGHPRDPRNLWPQPVKGRWTSAIKDQLEASVCRAVCRGDMTLEEGQAIFLQPDWTKEYSKFFGLERSSAPP
jgi:hypothetical protein